MKAIKFYSAIFFLSLAFILFYKFFFGAPYKLIVYHLFLIFLFITSSILIGAFVARLNKHYLFSIYRFCISIFLFFLILVYILSWSGKVLLNRPIKFEIFWVYLTQLRYTIKSVNMPIGVVFVLFAFAFLVLFFCIKVVPKNLATENKKLLLLLSSKINKSIFSKSIFISIALVFTLVIFFFLNRTSLSIRLAENQEPICEVFFKTNFNIYGVGFLGEVESPKTRLEYPKNINFQKKNIVIIIVDALRADYLPMYGYNKNKLTFLDSLNKTGFLSKVDNVFASSANSFPCILGILRSKSWHNQNEYNFSITDLLYDNGYKTNFILAGDHTNFYSLKSYFGNSISYYFDGISSKKYYINDDNVINEGLENIKKMDSTPNFFYFHLMSMHETGLKHKENILYTPASAIDYSNNGYINNYTNGLIQLDTEIKNIFNTLKNKGYLDNSIICITSDHGESLGNRNFYGHSLDVYNDQIRVPLLFYDQDTSINYSLKKYALQSDISATIIDRIGLPIPNTWEGFSLLKKEKHTISFHTMRNNYAIIKYEDENTFKFCYNSASKKEEVFNLTTDLNETKNIIKDIDKGLLNYLKSEMKAFVVHCTK